MNFVTTIVRGVFQLIALPFTLLFGFLVFLAMLMAVSLPFLLLASPFIALVLIVWLIVR